MKASLVPRALAFAALSLLLATSQAAPDTQF